MDKFEETDHFLSGFFIIINIRDIRNMMMMVQQGMKALLASSVNMITSSEYRPLLSVTDKKEQNGTRQWLHHTLDWVLAFSGVWTSAGLWLPRRTWHYSILWWLVVVITIIKIESLKYFLVSNCLQPDELLLLCTWCIANNQAISDENSSCLNIHLFLNPEDDSRALILL